MGSSFSLFSFDVDAQVDVARLADRILSDPRIQSVLAEHAELARSLTKIHKDLAGSLSRDSQKLVQACEMLLHTLEGDSRTLTNELKTLAEVLKRESEVLAGAYCDLGRALTWATWIVTGVVVLCGAAYTYKTIQKANKVKRDSERYVTQKNEAQASISSGLPARDSSQSSGDLAPEEMMEVKAGISGGNEYVIAVPLRAIHMFSPTWKSRTG